MSRPPLSVRRDKTELDRYQQLHDGIPSWMHAGLLVWATRFFRRDSALQKAEQVLRVQLDWTNSHTAKRSLLARLQLPV